MANKNITRKYTLNDALKYRMGYLLTAGRKNRIEWNDKI